MDCGGSRVFLRNKRFMVRGPNYKPPSEEAHAVAEILVVKWPRKLILITVVMIIISLLRKRGYQCFGPMMVQELAWAGPM